MKKRLGILGLVAVLATGAVGVYAASNDTAENIYLEHHNEETGHHKLGEHHTEGNHNHGEHHR